MKNTLELAPPAEQPLGKSQGTTWWKEIDRLLRGEATQASALGNEGIGISSDRIQLAIVLLGMTYGVCMGMYGLLKGESTSVVQLLSVMVKVPALFLLTLVVTFPSLYVFNALAGSRLSALALWRLLTSSIALNMAILASFGPIVAFFSVSTKSYSFMLLLNVLVFSVAGGLGLKFLLQTLCRLAWREQRQGSEVLPRLEGLAVPPGPLEATDLPVRAGQVKMVFTCWMLAFALVGAQMSWLLRPYLGSPDQPFAFFRSRESNFFEAVWHHLIGLLN